MRKIGIGVLILVLVPQASRAVDKKRLQELLYLPTIDLEMILQCDPDYGVLLKGATRNYSREIAQARRAMLGDSRDAERYRRIAKLYSAMGADKQAQQAFVEAEKLYRQRLKQMPNDAAILSALGGVLTDLDEDEEGERLLRKAAQPWHGHFTSATRLLSMKRV